MVWQQEQQLLCSGCGLPRDETMQKDRQFAYRAEPVRCHACKAAADAERKFLAAKGDMSGLTYRIDGDAS